jgi:hypothetical protein
MTSADKVDLNLTADERYLLIHGLNDWDPIAPARATEAIAQAIRLAPCTGW